LFAFAQAFHAFAHSEFLEPIEISRNIVPQSLGSADFYKNGRKEESQ